MPSRLRVRRVARWALVVLTAAMVIVWLGSARVALVWRSRPFIVQVVGGRVDVRRVSAASTTYGGDSPLHVFRTDRAYLLWRPMYMRVPGRFDWIIGIPLWAPATLVSGLAMWTWRRLKPRHGCVGCGYSLQGLSPGARCPECGTERT